MDDKLSILLATDFSQGSKIALNFVIDLQKKYQIDLSLIHVVASFWKDWLASGLYQKESMQRLQSWQQTFVKNTDQDKLFVGLGNPADTIVAKAESLDSDLIVLGGKNTKTKGRYKSGTTVESVVRNAKKSVLVCKQEQHNKIICGVDCSPSSAKALNFACHYARHLNIELIVLFVMPKVNVGSLGMGEEEILAEETKIEKISDVKLKKFLQEFDFTDIRMESYCKWGVPSHVILDMAEDHGCDLIAVGAKGQSFLEHVLMGSTSEKILRFAPGSLLVAR